MAAWRGRVGEGSRVSPLGAHGPLVASIVGAFVVGAFVLATIFRGILGLEATDLQGLREFGLLALGAIFGLAPVAQAQSAASSAADTARAAHSRLDAIAAPPATHGNGNGHG